MIKSIKNKIVNGKEYFKKLNKFLGERLLKLPLLSKEFNKFNSLKLQNHYSDNLNHLLMAIKQYTGNTMKPSYGFISTEAAQRFSKIITFGIDNNLLVEKSDLDLLEKIPAITATFEKLNYYCERKDCCVVNLPSALKKYSEEIGESLENKKAEITDLLTTSEKRISVLSETILSLLLKAFAMDNNRDNHLFIIAVITYEGYRESLYKLTMESVADPAYSSKLRSMWPSNYSFVKDSNYEIPLESRSSLVDWKDNIATFDDFSYRINIRAEAIKSMNVVQASRNANSGPLIFEGYFVFVVSLISLSIFPFTMVISPAVWFLVRQAIEARRAQYKCLSCGEMWTTAIAKSDYLGSEYYTETVATQNNITNKEGEHIATIHGNKNVTKVLHISNEHRCCLCCGVISQAQVATQ